MYVRRLIWEDGNLEHIALHAVTREDVEQVCQRWHLVRATYNERLLVVGTNQIDTMLTVVLAPKGDDVYYLVTARPASRPSVEHIVRRYQGERREEQP